MCELHKRRSSSLFRIQNVVDVIIFYYDKRYFVRAGNNGYTLRLCSRNEILENGNSAVFIYVNLCERRYRYRHWEYISVKISHCDCFGVRNTNISYVNSCRQKTMYDKCESVEGELHSKIGTSPSPQKCTVREVDRNVRSIRCTRINVL